MNYSETNECPLTGLFRECGIQYGVPSTDLCCTMYPMGLFCEEARKEMSFSIESSRAVSSREDLRLKLTLEL